MNVGLVLVLDGPSSVGKSTTLAALQRRWPVEQSGPLIGVGLDATRAALGAGGSGRWADLLDRVEPSIAVSSRQWSRPTSRPEHAQAAADR